MSASAPPEFLRCAADSYRSGHRMSAFSEVSSNSLPPDRNERSASVISRFRSLDRSVPLGRAFRQKVKSSQTTNISSCDASGFRRVSCGLTQGPSSTSSLVTRPSNQFYPEPLHPTALGRVSPTNSTSSSSSQRLTELWEMVQDLRAENAVLQQRVSILMEEGSEQYSEVLHGIPSHTSDHDDSNNSGNLLPCCNTATPDKAMNTANVSKVANDKNSRANSNDTGVNGSGHMTPYMIAEREAMICRIRRLEMALKLEAMERDALELRLRAQERVLARLALH
uniref:WGS project CAEQ00000000 data, annotated contig 1227 n=1 Tax=Trypanosoma congolense (strain IL3000) TaxID=1068625 RepID=F9W4T8_TRYCI|nr:unnamed protein product [Trypanosoma congolense IL3000]